MESSDGWANGKEGSHGGRWAHRGAGDMGVIWEVGGLDNLGGDLESEVMSLSSEAEECVDEELTGGGGVREAGIH